MKSKQDLIIELLQRHLADTKIGIIVKGVDNVSPEEIIKSLAEGKTHLYAAAVGYKDIAEHFEERYEITNSIENAVRWRSNPQCAGNIIVFIRNDTDKLHSLAEFDVITIRDAARLLIEQQINDKNNLPTNKFWRALLETPFFYTFETLHEFTAAVKESGSRADAIPQNMWRLNLLNDSEILGMNINPAERIALNLNLISDIGHLSENSRKKLSHSLVSAKEKDKDRLRNAYNNLQNFYKYGNRETLKALDMETARELFSASRKSNKQENEKTEPGEPPEESRTTDTAPIRPDELDTLISGAVVNGDKEARENIRDLLAALRKHYDTESEEDDGSIPIIGGIFDNRNIVLENHQIKLRKLVGKYCSATAWGGIMETDETVLKNAVSGDINSIRIFDPDDKESAIAFHGGIDGSQSLFNFIVQFDAQFDNKALKPVERFSPIIENLKERRTKLLSCLDLIMYHPVLLFGASEEDRLNLIEYIKAWERLYHAFCVNEPVMRQISAGGTSFIARAILLPDILYVKTPGEWKGILLPLHPVYLWRYYEVFRALQSGKSTFSEENRKVLARVFSQLPQVLNFIVVNNIVTNTVENCILPCSGSVEMLPTFENKTNRYLGNDGTESIEEILTRWTGFAPYTKNEVRVCTIDSPDLTGSIRQIKSFMDKNSVKRVVYDVYLTREQNGNNELSKLDYSDKDYEIGEYIRNGKISISIRNARTPEDVKKTLSLRPVHAAFYFDQSSYTIEYGPNSDNLYITPLVITYDYDFDEIRHKGSIYPSTLTNSSLIGDYHKLLRLADIISNNMNPRTTSNGNADITAVTSTIKDRQTQWLVAADRNTNNYQPEAAIPIGEKQYDNRKVNVWAADDSRIISQYLVLLRRYNLYPKPDTLIDILRRFGHIASNGLINIPKSGADARDADNKRKGLMGTLFAASWYMKRHHDAVVVSLDNDKARLWLHNSKFGNERADLLGLYYDCDTLYIEPIEVKTRDESPEAAFTKDKNNPNAFTITGHAANQIASMVEILREIFATDTNRTDMFTTARREVLKFQIVTECFRNVNDPDWQKKWYLILKRAFSNDKTQQISISISGLLLHVKLNDPSDGEYKECRNPDFDNCKIDYFKLTALEIQKNILDDRREVTAPGFDNKSEVKNTKSNNAVPDVPAETAQENRTFVPDAAETKEETENDTCLKVINQLVKDFRRSCGDYNISLRECNSEDAVVGSSVIRLKFKLGRGQALQGLSSHLEDIGREMKRTGVIIQQVPNSDELLLDVPRLKREKVLFRDVILSLPEVTSPEQLFFPLGRTPGGKDLFEDLGQMPHLLVGGSTGSGKSVFLFSMLAAMLMTHPRKEDLQLVLSSAKLEDFIHFEGLPHLYSNGIISDAAEAARVIKEVVFEESERRGKLLAEARVANIIEYNRKSARKLAPIVIVIDEFADLADQLETKKEQNDFYKPVQRIAQAGRSRGIHLVICTQRPEAKLVPSTTKAQLNGRVALRVNDGISSRMIIEEPDAQYLQKHGDMIYRNGDVIERAQGYLIDIPELDQIVKDVIDGKFSP